MLARSTLASGMRTGRSTTRPRRASTRSARSATQSSFACRSYCARSRLSRRGRGSAEPIEPARSGLVPLGGHTLQRYVDDAAEHAAEGGENGDREQDGEGGGDGKGEAASGHEPPRRLDSSSIRLGRYWRDGAQIGPGDVGAA